MRSMKGNVAGLLMVFITTVIVSVNEHAAEFGDFTYSEKDGKITIEKYNGKGGDIAIPEEIIGKPVTFIGEVAVYYCRSLTSITISNNFLNY